MQPIIKIKNQWGEMNSFKATIPEDPSGLDSWQERSNTYYWFWIYFLITSKGAPPVETTKYPEDQRVLVSLSEAPWAYKNIELIMEAELDLIKPITELWPLEIVKR